MVLVGKVNKEIVAAPQPPRPARGGPVRRRRLAVSRRAPRRARRRGHRLRRAHRARQRRRAAAHRPRLHPRDRLRRRRPRGALLQHQRRRGRRRGGRRAGRLQGGVPHRRPPAGWPTPRTPPASIGQATTEQVRDALPGLEGGMRPKLAGLPGGDPREVSARRTSSTGGSRTRCCWSCSPTRASARR